MPARMTAASVGTAFFAVASLLAPLADGQSQAWVARHNAGSSFNAGAMPGHQALAIDAGGNVYVAGQVYNSGAPGARTDLLVVKYGPTGLLLWSARSNVGAGGNFDDAQALVLDAAGNVYVAGHSNAALVAVKYSPSGQRLWRSVTTPPGSLWGQVAQIGLDGSGNLYVGGSFATRSFEGFEGYDYALVKYDAAGTEQWLRTYASPGPPEGDDDILRGLGVDASGRVIATGSSRGDFLTRSYDSAGALLWSVTSSEAGYAAAQAVVLDSAGNAYVTGSWPGPGNTSVYGTIKYDAAGAQQWLALEPAYGGSDAARDVALDAAGNVYVTGYVGPFGATDQLTVKYAPNGVRQWSAVFDGAAHGEDRAEAVTVDAGGNVYVTGYSSSGSTPTTRDFMTLKYDSAGGLLWQASWDSGQSDWGYRVAVDAAGSVYVTGLVGGGTQSDFRTLKYDPSGVELWSVAEPPLEDGSEDRPASGNAWWGKQALAVDPDGNVYVTGDSSPGSSSAFLTVKYDALGALQWARIYDHSPTGSDGGIGVAVDAAGNVFAAGVAWNGADHDLCVLKYDSLGTLQWARTQDGLQGVEDYVVGIGLDAAGNVYAGGYAAQLPPGAPAMFAAKYDTNGNLAWVVSHDEPGRSASAAALRVDAAGNVYLTGSSSGSGATRFLTVKLDTQGQLQWSALEPTHEYGYPHALALDAGGNVYVAGESYSGTYDYLTLKYSPGGTLLWARSYDGSGHGTDRAHDVAVDQAGSVYVVGQSSGSSLSYDFAALKYSPAGTLLWSAEEDAAGGQERGYALALDPSGNLYVAGESGLSASPDYHIVSYAPSGLRRWAATYAGPGGGDDVPIAVVADASHAVYVTGWSYGQLRDFLTVKYDQDSGTDLVLSQVDAPDPAPTLGQVSYTLTATNAGPWNVGAATLVDTLPAGLSFVSADPPESACAHVAGTVTCQLGPLDNQQSRAVTIVAAADAGTYGLVVNTAQLEAVPALPDPAPGNNVSSAGTRIGWIKGDQNDDLQTDIYLQDTTTGQIVVWFMNGVARSSAVPLSAAPASSTWRLSAVDDFDGDRRNDLLLWDSASGSVELWLMNGSVRTSVAPIAGAPPSLPVNWSPSASADFDHDGHADLLWRNNTSQKLVVWLLNGTTRTGTLVPTPSQAIDPNWEIVAAADYDGDGHTDLLWYNRSSGRIVQWLMDANVVRQGARFTNPMGAGNNNWKVLASGDYGSGPAGVSATQDVVWRNATSGRYVVWYLDTQGNRTAGVFTSPDAPDAQPLSWTIAGPR